MKNIEIEYAYVDASNYKNYGSEVVAGTLTEDQKKVIRAALEVDDLFLPAQVGLATLQSDNESYYDDDHVWHRLVELRETDAPVTLREMTASEWAEQFKGIVWDVAAADADLEAWKSETPRGPIY